MKALLFITSIHILAFSTLFCAEMNKEETDKFVTLRNNYLQFQQNHCYKFPTKHRIFEDSTNQDYSEIQKLVTFAKSTHPIMDDKVKQLCNNFLSFKQQYGSDIEKNVYKKMTLSHFIIRLLEKRPLTSINSTQATLEATHLRNKPEQTTVEDLNFTFIGTSQEKAPLILEDYLSYDEMKVAALIGIASPTFFINDGSRLNNGIEGEFEQKFFQHEGVYIGLVGARFEKPNKMEWQDILITKEQNTKENGYGLNQCNTGLLKVWSDFYGCKFPTYDEAQHHPKNHPHEYVTLDQKYFNIDVYKKRIEFVVKPFLFEANQYGQEEKKKVYIHAVGLGTGVWAIHRETQEKAIFEVYKKIIKENHFGYISDVDFSWFGEKSIKYFAKSDDKILTWKDKKNHSISIHFSQRNPASKLMGINQDKLLVACYPWDGNAYPGNEYWIHSLTSSGDPAAACCSYIAILQNILINPYLKENILQAYASDL